jgi:NAD-specific glutamate dehydrogenase
LGHSLKKEITATVISNLVVNISGVAAIVEILRSSPYDLSTVATGLVSSLRVLDASRRVDEIFSDESLDQPVKVELLALISSAAEGLTRWVASQRSLLEESNHIQRLADLANGLSKVLDAVLEGTSREHYRDNRAELKSKGANESMTNFFAAIPYMSAVVPLDMLIEKAPGLSLKSMIWTFFRVGEIVGTPELFSILRRVQPKDRWEQALRASVISDLYLAQVSKTEKVLDLVPIAVGDAEEMKLVAKEIATRLEASTNKIGYLIELLRNDPDVGIVAVSTVAREISVAD